MSLQIKNLPSFTVVGTKLVGASVPEIVRMWDQDFIPRVGEIRNRIGGHFYGLMYTDESLPEGRMPYMAAAEVSSAEDVPDGMVSHTVPALRYAVYTHKGKASTLGQGWEIANREFHEAGYECGGVFFEWYPPDYDDSENSTTDLYFSIK